MATAIASASPGYVPRSATNELKEIVEDHYEELFRVWDGRFAEKYGPLHPRLQKLFERFLRCGDPHFGFLRLYCQSCGESKYVPHSCKVRGLCPACSQKRALLWAERLAAEVLPDTAYAQIVFTIPKLLRKAFLFRRELYGELCRVAYSSTRQFLAAHYPRLDRPVPAMIVVPQSHGSLANVHPHLHSLSSLGVYDREGGFHPAPQDLDFSPLEEIFRQKTLKMLLQKGVTTEARVEMLRGWRHSGFTASADRRIEKGSKGEIEKLLQYMLRCPISLRRLEYDPESQMVTYRGKFHPALGRDFQHVSGLEFLAMLIHHILLRYETVIYYYGALSTKMKVRFAWTSSNRSAPDPPSAEEAESEFVRQRRKSWARLIAKVWLEDPEKCPRCGERMRVIAAISSPAQDMIIEKILKSIGQWNPPWLRERKIRAPPRSLQETSGENESFEDESFTFSQQRPGGEHEWDQSSPWGDVDL